MKNTFLLLFFVLSSITIHAQEKLSLQQCQDFARQNHPAIKQLGLLSQITELKNEINASNLLPVFNLNGQATYQSDVTQVAISIPGMNIPTADKDQYKLFVDIKQTIWDGGLNKAREILNEAEKTSNLQSVELELYSIKTKINELFFTGFSLQENKKIIDKKTETLNERKKVIESAVKHGVVLQSELDQLYAEIIKNNQLIAEINSNTDMVFSALSILTGKQINNNTLVLNEAKTENTSEIKRIELSVFEKQHELITANSELLKTQFKPKFFGFGQAGYGKPGLNMLSNKFDKYFIAGLGFSWNIYDWKTNQRQREILNFQQDILQTKKQEFERNLNISIDKQIKQLAYLNEILLSDRELIALREKITRTSASKLGNGTITAADYIQDLNAETTAKIVAESRKIQIEEAKIKLTNLLGNQ